MTRGKFITLEGGEGCGKSTQARLLKEALEKEGVDVVLVREPGGTGLGEKIRSILKSSDGDSPCDRAELLLFEAARAQLVEKAIKPALEKGQWVISDRFCDSTIAYQGYGRSLPIEVIRRANEFATDALKIDLTILFDVDPETARKRMRRREDSTGTSADRIECAGEEFHRRLRDGFFALAKEEPERFVCVDANGSEKEVEDLVWKSLKRIR
jgi:dTMP kinase